MTERAYVEFIAKIAQSYMDGFVIDPAKGYQSLERWNTVKEQLSAPLVIEMAQAWLEKHGKGVGITYEAREADKPPRVAD